MSMQQSTQNQLRQFIEQIERLEAEKKALGEDIKDKFLEAKAMGFAPKIMKQVLKIRQKPKVERDEEEALLETYLHALEGRRSGDDTPMGGVWAEEATA